MRFLIDANMPRTTVALLNERGHTAVHVRDIGLGDSDDGTIAERARSDGAVLVTRDLDFANILAYPPESYAGLVVVRVPDDWTAKQLLALWLGFIERGDLLAALPGRLAILEEGRTRFRPAVVG
jgi:predicted nuclease of predicted toxin-antitoxin system